MDLFSSILLGIIQGLTEFLPVSSSGHLVIAQHLIPNFSQPGILLEVVLHLGTVTAVVIYFKDELTRFLKTDYLTLLLVGTIPAVVVGFLFKDQIELLFDSVKIVGVALIITGVFNLMIDQVNTSSEKIVTQNALIIGLFQALAIIPGVSRSGSTIFAAATQKINKDKAAEFSFILSLPAVLGANVLEIFSSRGVVQDINWGVYLACFTAAFASGYIAIKLVFNVIARKKFEYFAYYCFVLGLLTLIFL